MSYLQHNDPYTFNIHLEVSIKRRYIRFHPYIFVFLNLTFRL